MVASSRVLTTILLSITAIGKCAAGVAPPLPRNGGSVPPTVQSVRFSLYSFLSFLFFFAFVCVYPSLVWTKTFVFPVSVLFSFLIPVIANFSMAFFLFFSGFRLPGNCLFAITKLEMGTLCNACGINYRRALAKSPSGTLNLDRLAEQMGHTRLSIQKALKRQRKLSAPAHDFKRTRSVMATRASERGYAAPRRSSAERYPVVYSSSPQQLAPNNSHSSLNMLLSGDDGGGHQGEFEIARRRCALAGGSLDSAMFPVIGHANDGRFGGGGHDIGMSLGVGYGSPRQAMSDQERERTSGCGRPEDQSRLPPFQAFIGNLERRTSM